MNLWRVRGIVCAVVVGLGLGNLQANEPPAAAKLLPATTLLFSEIHQPHTLAKTIENHPLVKRLLESELVQRGLAEDPEHQKRLEGLRLFEQRLGHSWQAIVEGVAGGGITLAIEPGTQGGVLLMRAKDSELLSKTLDLVLEVAEAEARREGRTFEIHEDEYRGVRLRNVNEGHWAQLGDWLLITNRPTLARMVIDQHQGRGRSSLADDALFQKALAERTVTPGGWSYLRLDVFRYLGLFRFIGGDRTDNPGLELLAGGLIEAVKEADYVTSTLSIQPQQISLRVALPYTPSGDSLRTEFYFPAADEVGAAPLLMPEGTLLSASVYRDLEKFWVNAQDLFSQDTLSKFSQAESTMSLFFSGRDFATEVLPDFAPRVRQVVARSARPDDGPRPAIQLPDAALVMDLNENHKLENTFTRAFQSAVGVGNLGAIQAGQPQLDMSTLRLDNGTLVTAEFARDYLENNPGPVPVQYNFTPSLLVGRRHAILSSNAEFARSLAALAEQQSPEGQENMQLVMRPSAVAQTLEANREALIANSMLEKGHSRAAAEAEIDLLFLLLQAIKGTSLNLDQQGSHLRLAIEIDY